MSLGTTNPFGPSQTNEGFPGILPLNQDRRETFGRPVDFGTLPKSTNFPSDPTNSTPNPPLRPSVGLG